MLSADPQQESRMDTYKTYHPQIYQSLQKSQKKKNNDSSLHPYKNNGKSQFSKNLTQQTNPHH
uniref:Uncharacterized protein n=1 Tax=Rhizophora mucronata TaxID=61149 RepID=A0A2P2JW90_RHIMU